VNELKQFWMGAVCISETKRFGSDMYEVDGYTILHTGRAIPGSDDMLQCKKEEQ